MNILKKYKYILYFLLYIFVVTTFLSLLNLLFSMKNEINYLLILVFMALYMMREGIKTGLNSPGKAYKEGLKKGAILLLVLYLLGCFTLHFTFPLKKIIYYVILLVSIVLGSIIGINKKKK